MATSNLESTTLRVRDLVLSSEVYSTDKVREFIDGVYAMKYTTDITGKFIKDKKALSPLSVITMPEDAYRSIADAEELESDALYLVETSCLNAYGSRLTDVGDPVNDDDAVNVRYLKKHVNSIFGEYVKASEYDVNEFINHCAESHVKMYFANTEAELIYEDQCDTVAYAEISCPSVCHQLSSCKELHLDEIDLLARCTRGIHNDDKKLCKMIITCENGTEISSINAVEQTTVGQILRYRFSGEAIDPSTCLSVTFRTDDGQTASRGLAMYKINGVNIRTTIDTKPNLMPVVLSIAGTPVQVARGIVMKDNEGNVRYLTIENGTINITRVDDI